MTIGTQPVRGPLFLGVEGGGTRTVAILADAQHSLIKRIEAGPGNLRLLNDEQFVGLLRTIARDLPTPDAIAIGLAGARVESDLRRIRAAAAEVWNGVPCRATDDLETALAAAGRLDDSAGASARVLVLSGTGSCCYGRNQAGKVARAGGWGHILGDGGSSYAIALAALRAVVAEWDLRTVWSPLGRRFLERLQLNEPEELITWAQGAEKAAIADLAIEVFREDAMGNKTARAILDGAAATLADEAVACARRLVKPATSVRFIFAGSTLLKQPKFARRVVSALRKRWRRAAVSALEQESAWGAVFLAQAFLESRRHGRKTAADIVHAKKSTARSLVHDFQLSHFARQSPTEQRNPRSLNLDKLPLSAAITLMLSEDAGIPAALLPERRTIERAVRLIARAFQHGGRLFYVGAGTSGRLGVLDASECPPTFGTDPEMVQGIIAGGQSALWRSVEGAEDDAVAGGRAIAFRQVGRRDVVVGITASGRTPFVWGALGEGKRRGAATVLLAFNPFLRIPRALRPDLVIAPNVGPEVLTGSTRLKAGTATKLILNIFTTLAMVQMGKVVSNLMVDLNPSNIKLRDRAVRIAREITGAAPADAQDALEKSGWRVKAAITRLRRRY
jgi:N-acetylmuramic acid 6-phosphate etherase